jgi:hypothetical protein
MQTVRLSCGAARAHDLNWPREYAVPMDSVGTIRFRKEMTSPECGEAMPATSGPWEKAERS